MRKKHAKTLDTILSTPTPSSLRWDDAEALLGALGASISEGRGSRVRVALNGVKAVFHRPHPEKEIDKGAVGSLKQFLERAGIEP